MPAEGVTTGSTSDQPASSSASLSTTPQPPVTGATSSEDAGSEKEDIKAQKGTESTSTSDVKIQESQDAPEELDDFGLPIRSRSRPQQSPTDLSETDRQSEPEDKAGSPTGEQKVKEEASEVEADASKGKSEQETEAKETEATEKGLDTQPAQDEKKIESLERTAASHEEPCDETADPPPPYRKSFSKPKDTQVSEWSHQRLTQPQNEVEESEEEEEEWKSMPALGEMDYYDDYGRLIARGAKEEDNDAVYHGLGGAGKGYTRVQLDEDAQSATSMDEDTSYLFREVAGNSAGFDGEELRDTVSQLQATKDLLNETQKIAYVGVVRLTIHEMYLELEKLPITKAARKVILKAQDAQRKWGQTMMGRLYMHMDISPAEQIMIEQLAEHGVQPGDLVRPLMQNARVKNPMAESDPKTSTSAVSSPTIGNGSRSRVSTETETSDLSSPPPYNAHADDEDVPEVHIPSQLPTSAKIDIDLRWTVLCDLFLLLIADSTYDCRSRTLLERVGATMDVTWLQISRFEKRVTDALEMQEEAEKETWDESEHMENRRKANLKQKYMIMGLATVGGGLVIGLSAGLLAPVIGAGLAAGLTTVGLSGTSAFLGGVGGTALIASSATIGGSAIGMKASHRRTGAVQTFEYRPLHNNKKLNLIVTVSGWMTGKVDDVRLPYSTVDPIMGDIYSVLWEPEMLRSMGDTINILATEVHPEHINISLSKTENYDD